MIHVFQSSLGKEELAAIEAVFESNQLGKGKLVSEFENKFARHIGSTSKHLITTNSCTEGLFSAMYLCDIQPGDEVITPTINFVGDGNAVCASGAKLVLCDVDKRTLNPRAEDIEKLITPKTKAILVIHYGGVPCDMDSIQKLADIYQLKLIEDCSHSVCSSYKGQALGTFGDIGVWSFDSAKILVCGDGAAMHFRNPAIKDKAEKWLYYGLETKSGYESSVGQKWWDYDISCYGHGSTMNDIMAAMALEQYKKLPMFIEKRAAVHNRYNDNLCDQNWLDLPLPIPADCKTSYYLYHIQVKNGSRNRLAKHLRENNIQTTYRYFPLHRVPGYRVNGEFPNADYATESTLCLPIHQALKPAEIDFICEKIIEFGRK